MWLSDKAFPVKMESGFTSGNAPLPSRRAFLLGALALSGCGFSPVYAPGGAGQALHGTILLTEPESPDAYRFARQFEERLGRAATPLYGMDVTLSVSAAGMGSTSSGSTTRFRLDGKAQVEMRDLESGQVIFARTIRDFTGFSTTGNTAATLAAQRDARARLMVLLADKLVDALILNASSTPVSGS